MLNCPRCGAPLHHPGDPGRRSDLTGVPRVKLCETCVGKEHGAKAGRAVQIALAIGLIAVVGWRVLTPWPTPTSPPVVAPLPAPPAPALPAPTEPRRSSASQTLRLINGGSMIANNDYPPAAQREGREGVVRFEAMIDSNGKVVNCTVIASSGHADLDETTCRLVRRRARFEPGRDGNGAAIGGVFSTRVRWQIQR